MYRIHILLLFFVLPFGLFASSNSGLSKSKETDQATVTSLSPSAAETGVSPDIDINVTFTVPLDEKQVKPNVIRLTRLSGSQKAIAGVVSYNADSKLLRFTPNTFLEPGIYEVDIDAIKAAKEYQQAQIKNIMYRFEVANVRVKSLTISPDPIEVDVNKTVRLQANVTYSDGSERPVIGKAAWSSTDTTTIKINEAGEVSGLKEGQAKVLASYKGIVSVSTDASVFLEINGYRLPFEPDPVINNSTLLGIDSNINGVRDDVERWIYLTYKDKHPIHIDIAMQAASAWQKVLEDPIKAKEIYPIVSGAISCEAYFHVCLEIDNKLHINEDIVNEIFVERIIFNTKERTDAFNTYDSLLSGKSYAIPSCNEKKDLCDFNISQYEE